MAKDLNGNIYIWDLYEFQPESGNLINEILSTAARDKSDVQYIELNEAQVKKLRIINYR